MSVFKARNGEETFGLGIRDLHVSNALFDELEYELYIEPSGQQKHDLPKIGQHRNPVVSEKGDLTGKMTIFGGFLRNDPYFL